MTTRELINALLDCPMDKEISLYLDIPTYCDIYKCDECPRYGDDCDGKFDDLSDEEDEEV